MAKKNLDLGSIVSKLPLGKNKDIVSKAVNMTLDLANAEGGNALAAAQKFAKKHNITADQIGEKASVLDSIPAMLGLKILGLNKNQIIEGMKDNLAPVKQKATTTPKKTGSRQREVII